MITTTLKLLVHDLIDTSTSTFPDARMVRGLNKAQDKAVALILEKDSLAQWDDDNYTDLNEGFLDITSGKNDYDVREDENFADILSIQKVYIKESSTATEYVEVKKAGKSYSVESGVPCEYRLVGKRIIFSPTFNYTVASGIKVIFTRIPQAITEADTTKEIGIPTIFHHLVALYTAYDFARAKRMDNRNDLLLEIQTEEKRLGTFVENQNNDTNFGFAAEEICAI